MANETEREKVGRAVDFRCTGPKPVQVAGHDLLVVCVKGRFTVFENRCPHLGFPLDDAQVVGSRLVCAVHGRRYGLRDGKPASDWLCPTPRGGAGLRLLETIVDGEDLYVRVPPSWRPHH